VICIEAIKKQIKEVKTVKKKTEPGIKKAKQAYENRQMWEILIVKRKKIL